MVVMEYTNNKWRCFKFRHNKLAQQQVEPQPAREEQTVAPPVVQPVFPPTPHPHAPELLQAITEGVPQFAFKRVVAICATRDILSKHLQQLASIDITIVQQFAERAMMQTRCQIEHQRLLALF